MPLYDYVCPNCNRTFEAHHRIADREDPTPCPDCGTNADRVFVVAPSVNIFQPRYFEHIAREPIYVRSKNHLKDVIKRQAETENTSIRNPYYDIEVCK